MIKRKGMGQGKGKGYKNIIGKDPMVHSQSAKGRKQPQRIPHLSKPKVKEIMTMDEVEELYEKELSEGTINTADTPHYNSLNQYENMLRDMGIIVET